MNGPWSQSWMREICTSGLMSGIWKRNGMTVTAPDLDSTTSLELSGGRKDDFRKLSIFCVLSFDHKKGFLFVCSLTANYRSASRGQTWERR